MTQFKNKLYIIIPIAITAIGIILVMNEQNNLLIWESLVVHSTIEAMGAFAAIIAGILLYIDSLKSSEKTGVSGIGFISMGILLVIHSCVMPGEEFVLLNSLAMLFGSIGFLISIIFDIKKNSVKISKAVLISYIAFTAVIGILTIIFRNNIPSMTIEHGFTFFAKMINSVAGIMFLVSALYYLSQDLKHKHLMSKLMFAIAFLFAASSLTFQYSEIWHTTWWLWHMIRMGAYIVIIMFILIRGEHYSKLITQQNAEINDINIKLKNYSYTISHDLKEPIRSIRTFSEFIKEDYEELFDDTAKDYFNRIIKASTKMAAMIDDLLVLSRVGRTDIEFSEVSVHKILSEVKEVLFSKINETNVSIKYTNMPKIYCQPVWMKTVFQNLISNSIKYLDEKKGNVEIDIVCKDIGNAYEFSVIDNGKGIPEDQHEKVFGLFRKAHSDRNVEGSGAGLAIVAAVVDQHQGKIWIDKSEVGVGTTLKFTIKKRGK